MQGRLLLSGAAGAAPVGVVLSIRHLTPSRNRVPRRLHPCGDGSASELKLTPGEGGVNADSRVNSKLKLLTPLKAAAASKNPVFATEASTDTPRQG